MHNSNRVLNFSTFATTRPKIQQTRTMECPSNSCFTNPRTCFLDLEGPNCKYKSREEREIEVERERERTRNLLRSSASHAFYLRTHPRGLEFFFQLRILLVVGLPAILIPFSFHPRRAPARLQSRRFSRLRKRRRSREFRGFIPEEVSSWSFSSVPPLALFSWFISRFQCDCLFALLGYVCDLTVFMISESFAFFSVSSCRDIWSCSFFGHDLWTPRLEKKTLLIWELVHMRGSSMVLCFLSPEKLVVICY